MTMRFTPSSLVFLALTAGVFTANLVASFSSSVPSPVAGRLQPANLVHLGTFQVPTGIHSGGQADAGFEYGGTALAFDATRNGLYMTGHDWDQFTGEISIPALGGTATLLQPLVDATEGKLSSINPTDTPANPANTPNVTASGTPWSRSAPKTQSATPPQLMLTKFITPYPVARNPGRTIWQRIGMLLPSKNPQPRPKTTR